MDDIKVSVIMNCYNGEIFLREAIDSLLAQTYKNWELVFWDNRSNDRSRSIVKSYTDSRIRYILAPKHTNLGTARRLAVNECLGEYISFLDTDDLYLKQNLEKKLQAIAVENAEVVYGGAIQILQDGSEARINLPKNKSGFLFRNLLKQFEIDVATMMVKRTSFIQEKINFDDRVYGSEEYNLMMRLAVNKRFAVINEPIAKVRIHRASLTYSVMEKWAQDRRLTLHTIMQDNPNLKGQYESEFREAFARADYYEARWLVDQGEVVNAKAILSNIKFIDWRYFGLYAVLSTSKALWNLTHQLLRSSRL